MKKQTKTFHDTFGKPYLLKVFPKERIIEIIASLDDGVIIEKLIDKHVNGNRTSAYLNVSTGKAEYHSFTGNARLQQDAHLILLEEVNGDVEEGLTIEDFLDENEIKKAKEDLWNLIHNLDDYKSRLIEAWKFYYRGFHLDHIKESLQEIYSCDY